MTSREKFRFSGVLNIPDFESFKQQESTFVLLNLFVLALLLLIHALFASYWGDPSGTLIAILAVAFLAQVAELIWLQTRDQPLGDTTIARISWLSICFNVGLAIVLAMVTNRPDTQYFVLLVVPVLVAAFRLTLVPTIGVVAVVDSINMFWVWHYAQLHGQTPMGEYFEAMTVSLIYAVTGLLVWLLVNNLRQKETALAQSLRDLAQARERALREEKLAAVGRLASAVAHEIRNPVAAIVSALSTAKQKGLSVLERQEMFQIASKEAGRLEDLTTDFLTYARPRPLRRVVCSVDDLVGYVREVCGPQAGKKGVTLHQQTNTGILADLDVGQVQQALVNIVINAIEASPSGGHVELAVEIDGIGTARIEVTNTGAEIPPESVRHIFEPFFTTKQLGTGLGLAIARGIAMAHGGDLTLSANEPDRVCFSLVVPVPAPSTQDESSEAEWVES